MGKPRAVRNRKNEMVSCWVCALFVLIVLLVKTFFIGTKTMGVFNLALIILLIIWVLISVFYTFQYWKWKKKNKM
jgi:hypothetical protein